MFSRVVEGADPYRDTEKPFISSPPNGCANNVTAGASPRPTEVCEGAFVCAPPTDGANKDTDTSSVSLRLPPSPTGEGS